MDVLSLSFPTMSLRLHARRRKVFPFAFEFSQFSSPRLVHQREIRCLQDSERLSLQDNARTYTFWQVHGVQLKVWGIERDASGNERISDSGWISPALNAPFSGMSNRRRRRWKTIRKIFPSKVGNNARIFRRQGFLVPSSVIIGSGSGKWQKDQIWMGNYLPCRSSRERYQLNRCRSV